MFEILKSHHDESVAQKLTLHESLQLFQQTLLDATREPAVTADAGGEQEASETPPADGEAAADAEGEAAPAEDGDVGDAAEAADGDEAAGVLPQHVRRVSAWLCRGRVQLCSLRRHRCERRTTRGGETATAAAGAGRCEVGARLLAVDVLHALQTVSGRLYELQRASESRGGQRG